MRLSIYRKFEIELAYLFSVCQRPPKSWTKRVKKLKSQKLGKSFIDSIEAKKLGYQTIHFSWRGIGDQILLLGAAEEFYKKTGRKLLLAVDQPEIFANTTSCFVLTDYSISEFWKDFSSTTSEMIRLPGGSYNLTFLNSSVYEKNKLVFPLVPMQGTLLSNLGCSGLVNCSPKLELTEEEKKIGRMSVKQITVMTGGNVPYKILPFSVMQEVVDSLKENFDVIQIGASGDKPLSGAKYMCGIPLRQAASILAASKVFIGTIGGLMHLAEAVKCPSVIAWSGEPEIYGGYQDQVHVFSRKTCSRCVDNELNPLFDECPNKYCCITDVNAKDLIQAALSKIVEPQISETLCEIKANKTTGLSGVYPYLQLPPAIRV